MTKDTNDTAHSPTFWTIKKDRSSPFCPYGLYDNEGYIGDVSKKEHAHQIVKCVNSHQDLVDALIGLFKAGLKQNWYSNYEIEMERAEKALKKAGVTL